jgi:hypothetical protein
VCNKTIKISFGRIKRAVALAIRQARGCCGAVNLFGGQTPFHFSSVCIIYKNKLSGSFGGGCF